MEKVFEQEIEFVDELLGDDKEHTYNCECGDGMAVGTLCDESNAPKEIKIEYPKLSTLDEDTCDYVLQYRGLYDLTAKDINYGDVMMALGKITEILKA